MAVKYICDNCESDCNSVGRVTLRISVSTPHVVDNLPGFDGELCALCLQGFTKDIAAALPENR